MNAVTYSAHRVVHVYIGRPSEWGNLFSHKPGTLAEHCVDAETARAAMAIAAKHHPAWYRCSDAVRKMHARNVHQILGRDLASPSRFVVCWTADGQASGGTGQALRIADAYGIRVFNLHDPLAPRELASYAIPA